MIDNDDAFTAYLECALWLETVFDEDGNDLGHAEDFWDVDDIDADTLAEHRADLDAFIEDQEENFESLLNSMTSGSIGHDFYLTRNRHGAGFWDRGLGPIGDVISDAARVYGEAEVTRNMCPTPEQIKEALS